jgi:hypothetical protein
MITVSKEDYSVEVNLKPLVCAECGSEDFKYQLNDNKYIEDAALYRTTEDAKVVTLGLDCCQCGCVYSLDLILNGGKA